MSQSREGASKAGISFECISLGSSIVVHCVWDFKQGAKPQLRGLCDANPILFLIHPKTSLERNSPRKSAVLTPGLGTYCHWERKMLKRQCGEHPDTAQCKHHLPQFSSSSKGRSFSSSSPPNVAVNPNLGSRLSDCCCHLSLYTTAAIVNLPGLLTKLLGLINLLASAPPSSKHSVCLKADFYL